MKTILTFFLSMAALLAADEIIPELRLQNGTAFKQVKVTKKDAAEIRIMHAEGFATVRLSDLSPEALALFGGKIDKQAESMADAERALARAKAYSPTVPVPSVPTAAPTQTATAPPVAISAEENAARAWEWYQWCEANPQGDAQINAQQRDGLLAQATQILQAWEAAQNAAAVAARSGSLSTRPAVPVGRSYHDPERVAERLARQQMQGAQVSTLDQFIAQAIQNRRMLVISYDDGVNGARLIEPYLLGVTTVGNPALQAWFVSGASASGQGPGWRTFLLAQITSIELADETFTPRRDYDGSGGGTFQSFQRRVE
jgi:hypothetical protein